MDRSTDKYKRVKVRVAQMQGFYYHLMVYLIINIALLIIRPLAINWVRNTGAIADPGFLEWLDLNMLLTPLLWGIALGIHYLVVFGLKIPALRRWEQKKLREILEKERPD